MDKKKKDEEKLLQKKVSGFGLSRFRFIAGLLRENPLSLGAVLIFGIIAAGSELLSIALLMPFIESLRGNSSSLSSFSQQYPIIGFLSPYFQDMDLLTKIRLIAVFLLAVEIVKGFSRFASSLYSNKLQFKINADLQMKVMDQLLTADRGFLHREKSANLYTILNNFTHNTGFVVLSVTSIVPDIFMTLIGIVILFSISAPMTLITLFLGVFVSLLLSRLTRLSHLYGKRNIQHQISVNHIGMEILSGMDVIRLFGRRRDVRERYMGQVESLRDTRYRQGMLSAGISPLTTVFLALTVMVILIASTYLLHREAEFWVSILLIFLVVFARLGGPMARMNLSRSQLMTLLPAVQSLQEFLMNPDKEHLAKEGVQDFEKLEQGIRFENVSFRYGPQENYVLKDLDFDIPRGKMTAIVGGSGVGKTTIVALLGRLHDPTSGRILVDGRDLREIKSSEWHRKIGVVSQNIFLFNDTVKRNIMFGKPEATEEEIEAAARKANAHNFITEMPESYETLVGDCGVRLSGGQAQRVSIARAILVEPELMILDEATSSLDSKAEKQVQGAIDKISGECTLLVVAHRLSTVQNADNIVVLHEGQIVEQGTHRELMEKKEYYWQYARLQDLDQTQARVHTED